MSFTRVVVEDVSINIDGLFLRIGGIDVKFDDVLGVHPNLVVEDVHGNKLENVQAGDFNRVSLFLPTKTKMVSMPKDRKEFEKLLTDFVSLGDGLVMVGWELSSRFVRENCRRFTISTDKHWPKISYETDEGSTTHLGLCHRRPHDWAASWGVLFEHVHRVRIAVKDVVIDSTIGVVIRGHDMYGNSKTIENLESELYSFHRTHNGYIFERPFYRGNTPVDFLNAYAGEKRHWGWIGVGTSVFTIGPKMLRIAIVEKDKAREEELRFELAKVQDDPFLSKGHVATLRDIYPVDFDTCSEKDLDTSKAHDWKIPTKTEVSVIPRRHGSVFWLDVSVEGFYFDAKRGPMVHSKDGMFDEFDNHVPFLTWIQMNRERAKRLATDYVDVIGLRIGDKYTPLEINTGMFNKMSPTQVLLDELTKKSMPCAVCDGENFVGSSQKWRIQRLHNLTMVVDRETINHTKPIVFCRERVLSNKSIELQPVADIRSIHSHVRNKRMYHTVTNNFSLTFHTLDEVFSALAV